MHMLRISSSQGSEPGVLQQLVRCRTLDLVQGKRPGKEVQEVLPVWRCTAGLLDRSLERDAKLGSSSEGCLQ